MTRSGTTPIAVLDTSVLYPSWSRVLLQRLAEGEAARFRAIWSREIARELWRVFAVQGEARGRAPEQARQQAGAALYSLRQVLTFADGEHRPPDGPASPLPDPDDARLWYAALNAGAAYIVSHNTHHFPPPTPINSGGVQMLRHVAHGVEFVTAIEFVEEVLGLDAAVLLGAPITPRVIVRSARSQREGTALP